MGVLIFIAVLVVLILVHEFGHFIVAKWSGMRVDEFGIGYPPKLFGKKIGETEYTINALPFGGFVRIYGEDAEDKGNDARAFSKRPRILQALVLLAGVSMNVLLAWVLFIIVFLSGSPQALAPDEIAQATNPQLTVLSVLPGSPAARAGLQPGDVIVSGITDTGVFSSLDPDRFTTFVRNSGESISFSVQRGDADLDIAISPEEGVISSTPAARAIGVSVAPVGIIQLSFIQSIVRATRTTIELLKNITVGIISFLYHAATLSADFSQISGPVGIAGVVATTSNNGLIPLLSLTAVISLNLAIINLLPIPALDGGRLVFVAIESIIRRPIPAIFARTVNTIGFALLLLLMVAVTVSDIGKLF